MQIKNHVIVGSGMSNQEGEKYKLFVALVQILRIVLIAAPGITEMMALSQ